MKYDPNSFTYGCEHEFADWSVDSKLPEGCSWNHDDYTIVNSNGVANDPKGKLWRFGGEINTRPTSSIEDQCSLLYTLKSLSPRPVINYRSNLHVHVRVPGLKDDLEMLKHLQMCIHMWMPSVLTLIEPIPMPDFTTQDEYDGAIKRYKRRFRSHQHLISKKNLDRQMEATSLKEFHEAEVSHDKSGKPMWHLAQRACVNLRQVFCETETIEFRHFPGTLDENELFTAILWCKTFLEYCLSGDTSDTLKKLVVPAVDFARSMPKFQPYIHKLEEGYKLTSVKYVKNAEIRKRNIEEVLSWGVV